MTKKIKILLAACVAILLAFLIWGICDSNTLVLTEYIVQDPEIPIAFDGFRIAQVSDLHNEEFGENNEKLIAMLRSAQPDLIAITGDLIDSRTTNIAVALEFARQALEIAPCYYVTGNHEKRISNYDALKNGLLATGVFVLEEETVPIERDGEKINLVGIHDVSFRTTYFLGTVEAVMRVTLEPLTQQEGYTILLSHRPEQLPVYAEYEIDLVLTGHAHGGQIRLPWIGGLYSPAQGLFPEYDFGFYEMEDTQMIVSRGIGNSLIPLRINNPPELVLITLTNP